MSPLLKLGLCLISYFIFGIGLACEMWGIKAGLGLHATLTIFIFAYAQFVVVVFTILEDVKKILSDIGKTIKHPSSTTEI